jgi:hypothetical protein
LPASLCSKITGVVTNEQSAAGKEKYIEPDDLRRTNRQDAKNTKSAKERVDQSLQTVSLPGALGVLAVTRRAVRKL